MEVQHIQMMHRVEKSMIVIIQKSWVIKMLFVLIIMHLRKLQIKKLRILQNFLSEKITIDFSKNNVNNITERNIKDYFIIAHEKLAESLLSDKELKKVKNRKS